MTTRPNVPNEQRRFLVKSLAPRRGGIYRKMGSEGSEGSINRDYERKTNMPERYTITLRPEGNGPPAAIRLRKLLKVALRQCWLRCVDVREETPATDAGRSSVAGTSTDGKP